MPELTGPAPHPVEQTGQRWIFMLWAGDPIRELQQGPCIGRTKGREERNCGQGRVLFPTSCSANRVARQLAEGRKTGLTVPKTVKVKEKRMSSSLEFPLPGLQVDLDAALGRSAAVARDQRQLG